jgi:hypothetical protein
MFCDFDGKEFTTARRYAKQRLGIIADCQKTLLPREMINDQYTIANQITFQ